VRAGDWYRMWYACRGAAYRIGYAESEDGIRWAAGRRGRERRLRIRVDSKMIAYPCVLDHVGHRYMLYNGNGHGKTGIGLAVVEHSATGPR
jgi:hypothetical protein